MKRLIVCLLCLLLVAPAAMAADTIKLGAFFDLSGRASFIGTPTRLVAEMVVAKINAEGGINGKNLELEIGDTEGDPAKAASIAKKFIYKDGVVAIIGPTLTDTGMNVKKIADKAEIPIVMTVGGDPVIMGGKFGSFKWVFKSPQRSQTAVERMFMYLQEKGLTKVALLAGTDGFGKDGARWMKQLAPQYGIELLDVMLKRVNYIESVRLRVYDRMISERKRIAAEKRSTGEGRKAEILGRVDRELQEITSSARREATEIRGQADAEAVKIYAEAYSGNSEFYAFLKSLESYKQIISKNTSLVLNTDSELLKYLERQQVTR